MAQNKINRSVDIFPIPDPVVQYIIYGDDIDKPVGYCIITARIIKNKITDKETREAALWHIFISEKYRGNDYGKCLIEAVKGTYDSIFTQAQTDGGKKLLIRCGFVKDKNESTVLRWIKNPA
jgi:ribosomal protein S18 acetylase RimI-like enzyme